MSEKLRRSGIDIIGDLPWGIHFCQFYRTKDDLTEVLIPYFKAGLGSNEFCLWITAEPLSAEEAEEALRKAVPDFDVYLKNGQIEIIPHNYWYAKEDILDSERALNGWVEKLSQAQENGYEGVRFSWNTSWLKKEDWGNFVDYERKTNDVVSNYRIISLCTYSLDAHDVTEAIAIAANHQFSLVKKEGKWEQVDNSGRKNLNWHKRIEDTSPQNKQSIRLKPVNLLSHDKETINLEFADIIDTQAIQSLIEDFYKLIHIPIGLNDLKGNVLVGVGWQDICTKFHRIHPETRKHCMESDTKLSSGVSPGESKMYKCKNNMWDIVTPIMVGGQHVGYVFSGQFFFEDEPPNYELFRAQARKYGFNEEEYLAALEKVPRLSREAVKTSMSFLMTLANMISQLSYNNIKLAKSLAVRSKLIDAQQESEKRERARSDELAVLLDTVPVAVYITQDPQALKITGNRLSYEWLGIPVGTNLSKSAPEGEKPEMFKLFKNGVEIQPEKMPSQMAARGIEIDNCELDILSSDGKIRHVLGNARPLRDEQGNLRGSISAFIDITERKKAEEALVRSENKFRTLAENSPDVIVRYDRQKRHIYVNPAAEEPTGYPPEEIIGKTGSELGMDSEIVKFWEEHIEKVFITGKPEEIEFQYESPDGKKYYFNTRIVPEFIDGEVISALAISRDITDIKKAEIGLKETLDNLEKLVEKRTEELEKAYVSLKESEKGLAEAQMMAHIGSWEWNFKADKAYWSEEMYRIFGRDPEKLAPSYNEYLSYIHPDDREYVDNTLREATNSKFSSIEYRIFRDNGEERIVQMLSDVIFDEKNAPIKVKGIVQDITERKKAEKALLSLEIARKKEIHHRIKNNLQVISSLLDLQAENLSNKKCVEESDVLNAFQESQDRIMSIALIHEELHEGGGDNTLHFSQYLEKLVENLFQTYSLGNADINLKIDLEDNIFFDMDIAVPLGIIVNELVSNSLKYAFPDRKKGEIRIKLFKEAEAENSADNNKEITGKGAEYTLIISDNGVGIPEEIRLENSDTLGLQLVNILVDQLNGEIELKRDNGTEFDIKIKV
ncbi:MAG TPA: PocR ligand-binding domain-containing protein [Methanosarcina thermophila]|nr:PocR ligand-binding domain-containing protein [Methanosarcina thermophila]